MDYKVFSIVDGHPTHKAGLIKNFVEENSAWIEAFFLPPYSPELNPGGVSWAHAKKEIGRLAAQTEVELKAASGCSLKQLQ